MTSEGSTLGRDERDAVVHSYRNDGHVNSVANPTSSCKPAAISLFPSKSRRRLGAPVCFDRSKKLP